MNTQTYLKKYESLNFSKLPDNVVAEFKNIYNDTEGFSDADLVEVFASNFNDLYAIVEKKYPDAMGKGKKKPNYKSAKLNTKRLPKKKTAKKEDEKPTPKPKKKRATKPKAEPKPKAAPKPRTASAASKAAAQKRKNQIKDLRTEVKALREQLKESSKFMEKVTAEVAKFRKANGIAGVLTDAKIIKDLQNQKKLYKQFLTAYKGRLTRIEKAADPSKTKLDKRDLESMAKMNAKLTKAESLAGTEPDILTANTYYWSPDSNAHGRRRSEERKLASVANYLESIGFTIQTHDTSKVIAQKGDVEVDFRYSESTKNVYKTLSVHKNGKKSNISAIRKIANA